MSSPATAAPATAGPPTAAPAPAFVAPDRELAKLPVRLPMPEIVDFCRRHRVDWLALFGSVLREDFDERSDVDVLVQYLPGHVPPWFGAGQQDELAELIGRDVDLHTPEGLNKFVRGPICRSARIIYDLGGQK